MATLPTQAPAPTDMPRNVAVRSQSIGTALTEHKGEGVEFCTRLGCAHARDACLRCGAFVCAVSLDRGACALCDARQARAIEERVATSAWSKGAWAVSGLDVSRDPIRGRSWK